jgi:hypothetical protein
MHDGSNVVEIVQADRRGVVAMLSAVPMRSGFDDRAGRRMSAAAVLTCGVSPEGSASVVS